MQQLAAGHLHRVKAILFDVHLATMASRTTLYVYSLPDNVGCDAVSPIATRDKSYRVKPCLFTDILNLGGSLADPICYSAAACYPAFCLLMSPAHRTLDLKRFTRAFFGGFFESCRPK